MKSILFLLASSVTIVMVSAVTEKWPKIYCLPGFDKLGGEKHAFDNGMACSKEIAKNPKVCRKECLYRWSGIMVRGRVEMGTQRSMENMLRRNFFEDTDEGKQSSSDLATKISTECKDKFAAVKDKNCKEWTPFYECVDGFMMQC